MSKYIVETSLNIKKVIAIGITHGGAIWTDTTDIENLEELNSDYINEHYSDLQDEAYNKGYAQCQDDYSDALKHAKDVAYKKGLHDGESKCRYCNEYQRGLDDAWEAAGKIVVSTDYGGLTFDALSEIFGTQIYTRIMQDNTAQEAIEKLKAYEEKKAENEIKVGDVVTLKCSDKHSFVVTKVSEESVWGVDTEGSWNYWAINEVIKTDKHYDIDKILGEMKE